jgi:hypothetical protein
MNLHHDIRQEYGQEVVRTVRNLENTTKKIARYNNHLRFSLHCKHHNVTPNSISLRSTVKGKKAEEILQKAERALLGARIGQINYKLKTLDNNRVDLEAAIDRGINDEQKKTAVLKFIAHAQKAEHETCKQRHIRKYQCLTKKEGKTGTNKDITPGLAASCISKWVKNCSKRILNDPELKVLAKGMNFAVSPKKIPVVEIVTATEMACKRLEEGQASELRAKVSTVLKNSKLPPPNISKEERNAIDSLRKAFPG